MPARAYIYDKPANLLRPLWGGPTISTAQAPVYPPNYGAFGTYMPGSTTTAPQMGTRTTVNGNQTYATAGQTITDKAFFGKPSLASTDITFERCIFHGDPTNVDGVLVGCTNVNVRRARFKDCLFQPIGGTKMSGINGHDFWLERCEFRDLVDPIDPFNSAGKSLPANVIVDQCWMHSFAYYTPDPGHTSDNQTHSDGIQIVGATGVVVRGNLLQGYYGAYGSHQPLITDSPTPSGAATFSFSAGLLNTTTTLGTTGAHVWEDNFIEGFRQPFNFGGAGVGADLGHGYRNKFKGDSRVGSYGGQTSPWTFVVRGDQTFDAGEGTANQNTYYDGTPALIARNG